MPNGDGNENGNKIIRSTEQKKKLHVQHTFLYNPSPLFRKTVMPFCTSKT